MSMYTSLPLTKELRLNQWNYMNLVIREVEDKHRGAWFLLAGDWNSHTGPNTFLHLGNPHALPEYCCYNRSSKDRLIYAAGHMLAKFCILFSFIWLNGLLGLDNDGDYTFLAPQGASVMDYTLVSTPLLPLTSEFKVRPPLLSDHLLLSCLFTFTPNSPIWPSAPLSNKPPTKIK